MRAKRTKLRRKETPSGVRWYVSLVHEDGHEDALGGFETKREATTRAAQALADASAGRYVDPSDVTVRDFMLREWLPARQNADLSPGTRDFEQTVVEAWILPHIGDLAIQRLQPRDIDALYATLRARGGRNGRPLRGKSVRNAHGVLSKALGDAVRRRHLTVNPVTMVDPPARDDSTERAAWGVADLRRFLEVASADRLGGVWRLALATGLRRGELLGLEWSDIDAGSVLVARQVLVRPRSVTAVPRLYVRATTKTRRKRRVRFDRSTAIALASWKARQSAEKLEFGPPWRADGGLGVVAPWVVTEPDGAVMNPDTFSARWTRLVAQAGVKPISLHGARHTYAEIALRSGVRLDVVSRQLGHASIATTANVYLHDDESSARAAADLVGGLLGENASDAEFSGEFWENRGSTEIADKSR